MTLQDITEQERTNARLHQTMKALQTSQKKIEAQNRELQQLASYDQLTGLLNRRAFFEKGEKLFTEYQQSGAPLACIMCDIDHFKSVNDNHGHPVGDEAIMVVTRFLQQNVRPSDLVGRYGGEEFWVVF